MELTKDIKGLLAKGADPQQVVLKLNESYLPKEKLMSLEDLQGLAYNLCQAGATPPTICQFVLQAVEGHRIRDQDQDSLGGHGIPPNFYMAGNIADSLYGMDLETRMKYSSFHLQTPLGRDIPGYEFMWYCMGRVRDEFTRRDWDPQEVLRAAKKLSLAANPVEGHKLIHAFPAVPSSRGKPESEGAPSCFNLLKPEFSLGDIFASYLHEAWLDFDQSGSAWGIYQELEEVLPLFAKEGLTPKDAALGFFHSNFHGYVMLGIMKGLGFNQDQVKIGIREAIEDYAEDQYDGVTPFGGPEGKGDA